MSSGSIMVVAMQDWLKTVGAIVAALGLVGGLVVWSHGQLRSDIRELNTALSGDVDSLRADIADVRDRLSRIEGHLTGPAQPAQ